MIALAHYLVNKVKYLMLEQELARVLSILLSVQDLFVRKAVLFAWRDSVTV